MNSPNRSDRGGDTPRLWVLHTQEGNGSAASLAKYLCDPAPGGDPGMAVSYHRTVDNDWNVVDVVPLNESAWSVADANSVSINVCFAGSRAAWTRQQWLKLMPNGIDAAAYLFVKDARAHNIPVVLLAPHQVRWGKGACDHNAITIGWGIGSHTDVGSSFPWDVWWGHVQRYSRTP